jgi:hypothetical protein
MLAAVGSVSQAADDLLGGMKLLPGYKHQKLQGIDSIVGQVANPKGLKIMYEIGRVPKAGQFRLGGDFIDRPKQMNDRRVPMQFYKEQVINKQPAHLAYTKDNTLMVSFPQKGVNFTVKVTDASEMADALLMILTYPNPAK